MTRTRSLFAAVALALAVPAAVVGCGGDDAAEEDPTEILTATFENDTEVTSGVLDISIGFSAGEQGSLDASLSGPFQADPDNPEAIPQFDLTASATGEGQGQSIDFSGALTVTEDNAFVTYNDQAYEVGTDTFSQIKSQAEEASGTSTDEEATGIAAFTKQCETAVEQAGGDTSACDIDFASWLENLTNEGTEDVEGTESTHISGDANIPQIVEDVTALAEATGGEAQIPTDQLSQVEDAVTAASIDVYSSTDDNLLTKLDASFTVDPTAVETSSTVPVTDPVDFTFSVTIGDVNSEQTIEAPSGAQPIDDLLGQLGGLGALGGLGGGLDTGGLEDLGGGTGGTGGTGGGGGGGGGASAGDADAYFECIEQAAGDPAALQACANEL